MHGSVSLGSEDLSESTLYRILTIACNVTYSTAHAYHWLSALFIESKEDPDSPNSPSGFLVN